MVPISSLSSAICKSLLGVFADIDDTISSSGYLSPKAYNAMAKVRSMGLLMIPVTGRPAGWCDHIARMWPVDGVVGENGAFYFHYDHCKQKFLKYIIAETSQKNRQKIISEILSEVPNASVASDQMYRLSDIAIDYCEDIPRLSEKNINKIIKIMKNKGMSVKRSSIHINGWFGTYDKLTMTQILMQNCFNINLKINRDKFIFIGDSPNDSPMFEFFTHSVGVANVKNHLSELSHKPQFITDAVSGDGFSEMVEIILGNN